MHMPGGGSELRSGGESGLRSRPRGPDRRSCSAAVEPPGTPEAGSFVLTAGRVAVRWRTADGSYSPSRANYTTRRPGVSRAGAIMALPLLRAPMAGIHITDIEA